MKTKSNQIKYNGKKNLIFDLTIRQSIMYAIHLKRQQIKVDGKEKGLTQQNFDILIYYNKCYCLFTSKYKVVQDKDD